MKRNEHDSLLREAAARATEFDFFLAKVFADYKRFEGLHELGLAQHLGCTPDTLARLALCRRPRREVSQFQADVDRIARHFGIVADKLAALIRYVDSMESLAQSRQLTRAVTKDGILLAARDQEERTESEEDESEENRADEEE